jgi:uncharacterized protein YbjQ (UPF0145 family)
MKKYRFGAILILIFFVSGCASNPIKTSLSPKQRARLNTIQVYKAGVNRPYKILGTVKGISCHRNGHQQQLLSEDEPTEGVRMKAAILDADAVINVACQVKYGTNLMNNGWSSIVCVGDAIKYED